MFMVRTIMCAQPQLRLERTPEPFCFSTNMGNHEKRKPKPVARLFFGAGASQGGSKGGGGGEGIEMKETKKGH